MLLFLFLLILVTLIVVIINLNQNISDRNEQIANLERIITGIPNNSNTNTISTINTSYEKQIEPYQRKIDEYKNEIGTYKNEIQILQQENEGLKNNLREFEKEVVSKENFILGTYAFNYNVVLEAGEDSEWELPLSVAFTFNEDNSVYGLLPGHESGLLVGTYEIFKDSVKCIFTEYENECSGTHGKKLDSQEIVLLKRVNDRQLSFLSQNDKPMSEDFDIDNGEYKIFTYEPSIAY